MTTAPTRSFTTLAVAIVVAAVIISATLFVALGTQVTKTTTSLESTTSTQTSISTLTSTTTVLSTTTVTTSTCGQDKITDLGGDIVPRNSTTDCALGLTLGLEANGTVSSGQNETIYLSLANDLTTATNDAYTGLPTLQRGPDLSSAAAYDFVLPLQPACGYSSVSSYEPAFITIYNASGSPLQLNDSPVPVLSCVSSSGQSYHSFDASQTITSSLSLGGYWTSPDANEPWVNATWTQFSPGSYMLVAFDPWGQTTELNFTVGSSTSTTATTNTTTNLADCGVSGEGTGFYVTVLSDSGEPIQGAQISGTVVSEVGSTTCQQAIGTYLTNTTESVLITPNIGSYYLLYVSYY